MGGPQQVDYDALARRYGAQPAVDYDALAQKHGATGGNQGEQESWLHRTFAPRPVEHRAPTGAMPGSFEGHPENVGEYIPASAGEILGGAGDITEGKIARGAHRIIGGVGNAALPMIPFVAAGAPAAMARTLIGGGIGGAVGSGGARTLGASEDQSDLAGDVGNIVGGYAGAISSPSSLVRRGVNRVVNPIREAFRPSIAEPTREVTQARGLAIGGRAPAPEPAEALGHLPVAQEAIPGRAPNVRGLGEIAPELIRPRAFFGGIPPESIPARSGLALPGEVAAPEPEILPPLNVRRPGEIAPELVQRRAYIGRPSQPIPQRSGLILPPGPEASPAGLEHGSMPLGEAIPAPGAPGSMPPTMQDESAPGQASRPVTENPVVGNFVRAMQKSGLPIAERPNLLLKKSGRVNRILGPDEELTGPLEKSLRQARRQMKQ